MLPCGRARDSPTGPAKVAGTRRALRAFFKAAPDDLSMAFVVVQHLDPSHPSLTAELVGRHTGMTVMQARDGMRVQPRHAYVIPRGASCTRRRLRHGAGRAGQRGIEYHALPRGRHRGPIDRGLGPQPGRHRHLRVAIGAESDMTHESDHHTDRAARRTPGEGRGRVVVVEDHPLMRRVAVEMLTLRMGLEVCGEADGQDAALSLIARTRPDLAVIDLSLGGSGGEELVRQLKDVSPQTKLLVYSMYDESACAERLIRAGASGYVNKSVKAATFCRAVERVLSGGIYVSDLIAARLGMFAAQGD